MDQPPITVPSPRRSRLPLLHPIALTSIAILVVNDHLLKAVVPGVVTGKLSDVAGLVFFPLLLASLAELVLGSRHRRAVLAASIATSVLLFGIVKTTADGAAAFALALGTGQWLLTLGPLRDAVLIPAVVVVDHGDLIAVPTVVVAWWIGTGGGPGPLRRLDADRRTSVAGSVALILAGLASMATSQGPAMVSENFESKLHLTADQPVAVRHLTIAVETDDPTVDRVTIAADLQRGKAPGEMQVLGADPAIDLTLIPDPGTGVVPATDGLIGGRALDATEPCRKGCTEGVTLIARLGTNADTKDIDALLTSSVFVEGASGRKTVDARISMTEDADRRFDGSPPAAVASADGTMEVRTDRPSESRRLKLRIDGLALSGPLAFPLVGRLSVRVVPEIASGDPYAANSTVAIQGGDLQFVAPDAPPIDVDWLGYCRPRVDCVIKIDLGSEYQPWMNAPGSDSEVVEDAPEATEISPGYVKLDWTVDAVLLAFDGRSLPVDGLSLLPD